MRSCVPRREIAGQGAEQLELPAPGSGAVASRHERSNSATRLAGMSRRDDGVALRRQDRADSGVGGRSPGAELDPGLEIFEAIDDAAAELRVARPGAISAVLLQCANGEADEASGLGCAQIAG